MAPSRMSSYYRSTVTMALCCIISEIKRNIGRKSRFFDDMFISFNTIHERDGHTDRQTRRQTHRHRMTA